MTAKVSAFLEPFDATYVITNHFFVTYRTSFLVNMFTDSKHLFDALTKGQKKSEKWLMIDVLATREAYKRFEMSSIGLVPGDQNPADALSKLNHSGVLTKLLEIFMDATEVTQPVDSSYMQASNKPTGGGV